jgi:hypothetical protein
MAWAVFLRSMLDRYAESAASLVNAYAAVLLGRFL